MKRNAGLNLITLLALLVTGCVSSPPLRSTDAVQVVGAQGLAAPTHADLYGPGRPYLVGPFDKLRIDVFGIEELSQREVQVDASGRISFPLAGVVEVSGKSPIQIETLLEQKLREGAVRNPQVTVNLEETVTRMVTVYGAVAEPGLYPVIGDMSLMRAIATAKGLGEFADEDDVVIFRTVNGQKMAALYNLAAIRRGVYSDPEIYANDIVVVGDSEARKMFGEVLGAASALASPLIFLLR